MRKPTQEEAEILALKMLEFIAADEDLIGRFFALTGAVSSDLGQGAKDPAFLGAVMDFVLGDENTARQFAEPRAISPDYIMMARQILPGSENIHWT